MSYSTETELTQLFQICDFIRKTKINIRRKITFILIVCRFLVHLHQLSALLRFLRLLLFTSSSLFYFSLTRHIYSLSIRMEKVSICVMPLHNAIKFVVCVFVCFIFSLVMPFHSSFDDDGVCNERRRAGETKSEHMMRIRSFFFSTFFLWNIMDDVLFFSCLQWIAVQQKQEEKETDQQK